MCLLQISKDGFACGMRSDLQQQHIDLLSPVEADLSPWTVFNAILHHENKPELVCVDERLTCVEHW